MPTIIEDAFPLLRDANGLLVAVIPSVRGIKYADGIPLANALAAMLEQITQSAANVAALTAALADMQAWLTGNLDYAPPPRDSASDYMTPLYAALTQATPQTDQGDSKTAPEGDGA